MVEGLLVVLLIINLAAVVLLVLLYIKKGNPDNTDSILEIVQGYTDQIREHIDRRIDYSDKSRDSALGMRSEMLSANINELGKVERENSNALREQVIAQLTEIRNTVTKTLNEVREDNTKQLDNMRKLVDKTLVETLETRLTQSYAVINKSLAEVAKGFGEIQKLSSGVSDLNKVFTNVKNRGVWGEILLNSLLEQMLAPEQFRAQVTIGAGREAVDFAVILPGKNDDTLMLPIDSKFPDASYQKLLDANDNAEYEAYAKSLVSDIKKEAKSISDKYIKPPLTTDFAILYLPTEGLFAEVVKREGLIQELQNKFRVMVAGPTTLSSLLSSLQMGFKTLAIEKRSMEIRDLLINFKTEFIRFSELIEDTQNRLGKVTETLEMANRRTKSISKKLSAVESITDTEELQIGEKNVG